MLKLNYLSQYRNRKGTLTFVYSVTGTAEELTEYKTSKGEFYRENDKTKTPLFFSTRFVGQKCDMIKTQDKAFVPDTTEWDQLANLSSQYGIDVALRIAGKQHEALLETA